MERKRFRELGGSIGSYTCGEYNSITDIEGVKVGHNTLHYEHDGTVVRTGVTAVLPHEGNLFREKLFAASYVINGFGKTVGTIQLEELGVLESPILLTNTLSVGDVLKGAVQYMLDETPEIGDTTGTVNVVVGECNDGFLNDIRDLHVKPEDAREAIIHAHSGPVDEGSVGAGTGMLCFGYKGGIGTSSRECAFGDEKYTVGALVLTNFGQRKDLRVPILNTGEDVDAPDGSIMIILATDAPLNERQLKRLAKRASFGLSRTGSYAAHGSGDVVLAFSTAHRIPHQPSNANTIPYGFIKEDGPIISTLFEMAVDSVEEAIWNSLCKAQTTTGRNGRKVEAIPLDLLYGLMK
ncbi:P1 family peptidase [Rossellomorea aquimaris]|nr:P1 family peptidase [Rossellomorea aquimaris]WRP06806.1 P1 family peptidase [Rossellomorea aquimaris]